jgi:REP element-mobilizing transposase RayT
VRWGEPMTNYRRNFVPGGSYFFALNLAERRLPLLVDNIELLRATFRDTRRRHPFTIDAVVVLPDHLHAIWTLPEGDCDFAVRWQLIKAGFSRALPDGSGSRPVDCADANAGSGSAVIGSTPCATKAILPGIAITSTSTRSSTAMWRESGTGRFRPSTAWCGSGFTPRIGQAIPRTSPTPLASGDQVSLAVPILLVGWVERTAKPIPRQSPEMMGFAMLSPSYALLTRVWRSGVGGCEYASFRQRRRTPAVMALPAPTGLRAAAALAVPGVGRIRA